jgi:hypothetical protein
VYEHSFALFKYGLQQKALADGTIAIRIHFGLRNRAEKQPYPSTIGVPGRTDLVHCFLNTDMLQAGRVTGSRTDEVNDF